MIKKYTKFVLESSNPCWKGYKQERMKDKDGKQVPNCVREETLSKLPQDLIISEEKNINKEFAQNRLAGATKISQAAKEKGGDALLTYHHFHVKLPYYKKCVEGKLDMQEVKEKYDDLLTKLYKSTRNSMQISQVKFQELVGEIEVLGELLIEDMS